MRRLVLLAVGASIVMGCGHRAAQPVVPTSTSATQSVSTCTPDAVASLEAVRQARRAGPDLASLVAANRAIVAESKKPRSEALARALADVEKDAEKRLAASEKYASAVTSATLEAQRANADLGGACFMNRLLAGVPLKGQKKKPDPKLGAATKTACERYSQLDGGIRWDDEKSIASFADDIDALGALPSKRTEVVARARALASALKGVASERAILTAPPDAADRAERAMSAIVGTCEPAPAPIPLVVAKETNPRALTVVVVARPADELAQQFEYAAQNTRGGEQLAQFYRGVAAGRLGSGFVIVTESGETFIVTNRHVVDLAAQVTVRLEDGSMLPASVAYIDAGYDLAVLVPKETKKKVFADGGFSLASRPPKDGDSVTATGYPGLMGSPSFQITQGHVSNEKLVLQDVRPLVHVQHTAAIDPGSSGGPLLGAGREVLGVNTFKLVGRENVNFAVPASAVTNALRAAHDAAQCDETCRARAAEDACLSLVTELGHIEPSVPALQRMLGQEIVSTHGVESHDIVMRWDPTFDDRFHHSPVATLSEGVARRLVNDVALAGGMHPLEACGAMRKGSSSIGKSEIAKTSITLADGSTRTVTMRWQTAKWVLADYPFEGDEPLPAPVAPPEPTKKPAAKPAAKKAKK